LTSIETNPCTREIQVEVPADVVATETQDLIQKYQKLARIPGFRRGKVPATVIRQRFAEDIRNEVAENLIPRYFRQETEKLGLAPVSQPRVTDLHLHDGEPLRFKATFEVMPEIEVTGYKELQPERKDTSVSDDDVQKALDTLRDQQASYNAVEEERSLGDGDYAQASFNGRSKDQPDAEPVKVDEVLVEIGGPNTVREFSDNLRGMKPGEEKTFEVIYAADFRDSRLAGKTMTYEVKVNGIKQKQVPELNDEFAKQVGEFETLDALKQRIRESLEHERQHNAEHEAKDKIVEELLAKNDFPVPEALVEHQIDLRLERGLRALAQQGMRLEDLKKLDTGRLRAAQREQALKEVRATLLLERIAEMEKIEVTDEEVDKEIEALAKQSNQTVDDIKSRLTRDGALDRIRNRIREEKTLDFLYRKSA
jgi:trigger factor